MKAFDPNNQWNIADKDGNIDLPDELFPLFNKVGIQIRLHRISGKNEYATIADIIYLAHKFFTENPIDQGNP